MDGLAVRAICRAWQQRLVHGRIDRVHQPGEREIVLSIRGRAGSERVLLSAHRSLARAHALRSGRPENPEEPPMFCLLLRRRIEGGRIVAVSQQGLDRTLEIHVQAANELGDVVAYVLVLDMMGKHSNLILCTATGSGVPQTVVDSIVRVPASLSRVRPLLPELPYQQAPAQQKIELAQITSADTDRLRCLDLPTDESVKLLCRQVLGIGPASATEALHRCAVRGNTAEALAQALYGLYQAADGGTEPSCVGLDKLGRVVAAAPFRLTSYARQREVADVDEALETWYGETVHWRRQGALHRDLRAVLDAHLDRLRGKLNKLLEQERMNQDPETPKRLGDLLTAYAHELQRGLTETVLPNFYDDGRPIRIPLDPALSPIENAQRLFRQSSKWRRSIPVLSAQRVATQRDLDYLEQVRLHLDHADRSILEEIRAELADQSFLQRRKHQQRRRDQRPLPPQTCYSSDGRMIRVGRNNVQNDRLTWRLSQPHDLWFHIKAGPGSHVVLATGGLSVSAEAVAEAALLAAWFSKARDSENVAVDLTEVRHVWKPNGARPGFALYDDYRTVWVTPDQMLVQQLLQRAQA